MFVFFSVRCSLPKIHPYWIIGCHMIMSRVSKFVCLKRKDEWMTLWEYYMLDFLWIFRTNIQRCSRALNKTKPMKNMFLLNLQKLWWFWHKPISWTHPVLTLHLPGQQRLRRKIVQLHRCSDAGHMTIPANVVSPDGALKQLPTATPQHIMTKGLPFKPANESPEFRISFTKSPCPRISRR